VVRGAARSHFLVTPSTHAYPLLLALTAILTPGPMVAQAHARDDTPATDAAARRDGESSREPWNVAVEYKRLVFIAPCFRTDDRWFSTIGFGSRF
jgi:hypothetical protein